MAHRPIQVEVTSASRPRRRSMALGDASSIIGAGSPRDQIAALQTALVNAGFPPEPERANKGIDGAWGPKTQTALMNWQRSNFKAQRPYADEFDLKSLGIVPMPFKSPVVPVVVGPKPAFPTVIGPSFAPTPSMPVQAGMFSGITSFFRERPLIAGALTLGAVTIGALLFLPGKSPKMGDVVSRRRARIARSARRHGILVKTFPDSGGYRWEVTRGGDLVGSGWEPSKTHAARAGAALKKRELPRAA